MEEERIGTLERVDLFYLPFFEYKNVLDEEQCSKLLEFCKEHDYVDTVAGKDSYAQYSADTNVIEKVPEMKGFFEKLVSDVSYQIMRQASTEFTINNSWCTKTEKGQSTVAHVHKNFYMSGVLYLQEGCAIEFKNPMFEKNPFLIEVEEVTPFTCGSSVHYPEKGSFILFPAWLEHGIPEWKGDETRYSIAMNIHPKGLYGLATSKMYVK